METNSICWHVPTDIQLRHNGPIQFGCCPNGTQKPTRFPLYPNTVLFILFIGFVLWRTPKASNNQKLICNKQFKTNKMLIRSMFQKSNASFLSNNYSVQRNINTLVIHEAVYWHQCDVMARSSPTHDWCTVQGTNHHIQLAPITMARGAPSGWTEAGSQGLIQDQSVANGGRTLSCKPLVMSNRHQPWGNTPRTSHIHGNRGKRATMKKPQHPRFKSSTTQTHLRNTF